ncbi:MAG: NAD(P)-binding protein [Burkholderiaceae bacterium]|nr:NAD(P)-binding protein [Burkholderiaceae bacterium]
MFSPLRLGRLALPDRFAMAPMTTNFAGPDGEVTPQLCDYLAARGRGGFSLVVTENMGVHPSGRVMPRMVMADDDRRLTGLARLADAIRASGAMSIAQISHCGRQSKSKFTGMPLVAPSAIPCPLNRELPRELAIDEIEHLECAFVGAAQRAEAAGFDGVEIHAAHGYLVSGFLSAYSNRRTDRYGGSLANRMRFLLNIVDRIRHASDLTLVVRISADEFVAGGNTLEQTTEIARALQAHGVSGISVSVGVYESFNTQSMVSGEAEGRWLPLAGRIACEVSVPVFGVGRIRRAALAEAAVAGGECAIPLFGRAAIADPELPAKVRAGREEDILPCVSCNVCLGRAARPQTICPINPSVGRDRDFGERLRCAAPAPLRIGIAGSCLASLTAAWIAAARGHDVTVYETDPGIGGMQGWRGSVPSQAEYGELVAAAQRRAAGAGVHFLRRAPQAGECERLWAVRRFQPVGAGSPTCYDVLRGTHELPRGLEVLVQGGDLVAAEAALKLAAAGYRTELQTPLADICLDAHPGFRAIHRRLIPVHGGRVATAVAKPAGTAAGRTVAAPTTAPGGEPDPDDWAYPYASFGTPHAHIGDAYEPGRMTAGVYEAAELAMAEPAGARPR